MLNRGIFLERVIWTPGQMAWEIANFLPSFYGLARAARDNANPNRFWDQETLMLEAQNFGFPSAPALLGALDQIRESLKSELSEADWGIFFKSTLDITPELIFTSFRVRILYAF